jgi:hypothetical protein
VNPLQIPDIENPRALAEGIGSMTGRSGSPGRENALIDFPQRVLGQEHNELIALRLTIEQKIIALIEFHDRTSRQ